MLFRSFEDNNFELPKGFGNLLRTNASIIGTAVQFNHKESRNIATFWQQMETNVREAGWAGDRFMSDTNQQIFSVLNFYNENKIIKESAEKLLSRFDLGLESFDIDKKEKENEISISANAIHHINGNKYLLDLKYESSGTKQLFVLLKNILQALAKGGIVVLDEFDVNLHPEMVLALFDLFIQPETNPKNAQLLMSTHSHMILSKLDKYQIMLVEKNENGVSEAWRLDEVDGVRADENYYSKYIAGAYSAVPKI